MDCPPTLVTPSQLPASILPPPNLLTSPNQAPAEANPNLLQKTACLPLQASSQVESYKMPFLQLLDQSYTGDIIWSDLLLGSLCLLLNFQSVPSLGCTPDMNDFLSIDPPPTLGLNSYSSWWFGIEPSPAPLHLSRQPPE